MTITHEGEGQKCYVLCYSCPSVSEENGDYGPPPGVVLDFDNRTSEKDASIQAELHKREYMARGSNHYVVVRKVRY